MTGVAHLPQWDVIAIEIALDLETPRSSTPTPFLFSGPSEPRICLVTAFALTSQLRHVIAAIDRVVPERLPAALRVERASSRTGTVRAPSPIAIQPMVSLLRLQRKFIRAIEPGLAKQVTHGALPAPGDMDASIAEYLWNFIPASTLPAFEPSLALREFPAMRFNGIGLTVYRLDSSGAPGSILKHWAYARSQRGSIHLRGGP